MSRRDIWLRRNTAAPLWEIEARQAGQTAFAEYASEAAARRKLTELLSGNSPAQWRRLSQ
jgi:hypothetical protein